MIEDPTLRELFKSEADERLQRLDDCLLKLAKTPGHGPTVEEAFREAHSLKGAARMLGLGGVQVLAHKLEDGLNVARRGGAALAPAVLAEMEVDLKALRLRVAEALGARGVSAPAPAPVPAAAPAPVPAPAPEPSDPPPDPAFRIDSVRVDTRKLDELMTFAGELTVTATRAARRLAQLDELLELTDAWAREDQAREAAPRWAKLTALLHGVRAGLAEDGARWEGLSSAVAESVAAMRLLPLSSIFRLYPRMVRDLAAEQGKEVELVIEGSDTHADKRILEELKDPLMHILRNAIDHGIERPDERARAGKPARGTVRIRAARTAAGVAVRVSDDGRGLDEAAVRRVAVERGLIARDSAEHLTSSEVRALIFAPGFSTSRFVTDVSGRGVGLDVVRANVERLKGVLTIESAPQRGLVIDLELPSALSTTRALLVRTRGLHYGLPSHVVTRAVRVRPDEIFTVEGRRTILHRGLPVSVAPLAELLELRIPAAEAPTYCVLSTIDGATFGVLVDELLDEQEVTLKPASALLSKVRNVQGATILNSGEICMVLEPHELLRAMPRSQPAQRPGAEPSAARKKLVLLAEDSITTRAQERRILEAAGYEVVTAADGLEALTKLPTRAFDAVVSDVEMPNMSGLELAERIRKNPRQQELPIILVTSLSSDADKRRGLEAGANAYISKPEFDQRILLDCLERLVG